MDENNDESPDETKHRKINNPLGTYSPEEEAKFLEGINLYGRDWKNVRESGEGYTLSGKPLDPNSASAKPYLANVNIKEIEKKLAKFNGNGYGTNNTEVTEAKTMSNDKENKTEINDITKSTEENSNDSRMEETPKEKNKKQVDEKKNENKDSPKKVITITINNKKESNNNNNVKKENSKKGSSNKKSHHKSKDTFIESIQVDEDGRTLYSKQRPKRSTAVKNLSYKEFMDTRHIFTETWKQNLDETKLEKVIKSLSYQLQLLNINNTIAQTNDQNNNDAIDNTNNDEDENIDLPTTDNAKQNDNITSETAPMIEKDQNNHNNDQKDISSENNMTGSVTENTVENGNITIDDINFDSDSELSDISTISSDISSLDEIHSDDQMDVSVDPSVENKKEQINLIDENKESQENQGRNIDNVYFFLF
ncbi:hypothetical protein PIROE2DRAFT_63959 [Piromyces sp. E2]|nr:hypothetical protein PIROE2DRAFT_63959 [Piromyces sp. E2]|eukprot:OUM59139.1 hypothetical protein PIROE2DRAFT_63959 [Piromyces sp. E2]